MRKASIKRKNQGDRHRGGRKPRRIGRVRGLRPGIGFFDHMLDLLARHSRFDITVKGGLATLHVDHHHTTEDVGIALGQAVKQALGTMAGITRYAKHPHGRWTRHYHAS